MNIMNMMKQPGGRGNVFAKIMFFFFFRGAKGKNKFILLHYVHKLVHSLGCGWYGPVTGRFPTYFMNLMKKNEVGVFNGFFFEMVFVGRVKARRGCCAEAEIL
jgi:hypothetical protein